MFHCNIIINNCRLTFQKVQQAGKILLLEINTVFQELLLMSISGMNIYTYLDRRKASGTKLDPENDLKNDMFVDHAGTLSTPDLFIVSDFTSQS